MTPLVRKATCTDINLAGDVLAAAMAADPVRAGSSARTRTWSGGYA